MTRCRQSKVNEVLRLPRSALPTVIIAAFFCTYFQPAQMARGEERADEPSVAEQKLTAADQFFLKSVRPLLTTRCISCHGADAAEGGLRLDSREAALAGGD